jgi:hypothetical protein
MLYQDTQRDTQKCIFLAGVARSGTTWLADIIRSQIPCRFIWEPFNPHKVEAFGGFVDFQYRRPDDPAPVLFAYAENVMNGSVRNRWVDRETDRIFFDYRLIKDVRVNLFLKWLKNRFPEIPFIYVMRHPCAVVLSRMEAHWGSDEDIQAFLSQDKLINDYLSDKMSVIKSATSEEEKHAVVWAIQNLVPLKQFMGQTNNVVFYENLCLQPEVEIPKIFHIIGTEYRETVFRVVKKPSRTVKKTSAVLTGEDKIARWEKTLSSRQVNSILTVVEVFGLNYIYGDSVLPLIGSF